MKRIYDDDNDTKKGRVTNNNNRTSRKTNDYYNEIAVNKVKNKYEESIQFQWIHLIARKYNIYNIDNNHQCFIHINKHDNQLLQQQQQQHQHHPGEVSRKSNSTIITPFPVIAPNFYGCIICGKYHFCNIDRRVCEIVSGSELDGIEMCRYSGKVLLVQDNLEPHIFAETQRMNSTRDALTFEKYIQNSYVPKGVREKSSVSNNKKMLQNKKKQNLITRLKENEIEKQLVNNHLKNNKPIGNNNNNNNNNNNSKKNNSIDTTKNTGMTRQNDVKNSITLAHNCDISIESLSEDYDNDQQQQQQQQQQQHFNIDIIDSDQEEDNSNNVDTMNENSDDNDDGESIKYDTLEKQMQQQFELEYESSNDDEQYLDNNNNESDDNSTEQSLLLNEDDENKNEHNRRNHDRDYGNNNSILEIIKANSGSNKQDESGNNNGGGDDDIRNNMNYYVVDDCEVEGMKELRFSDDDEYDNIDDDNNDDGGGGGSNSGRNYDFVDTGCGGAYIKNYHNNLEYNNRYYSFISTIIRKWKRKNDLNDLYNRDIQLDSKTMVSSLSSPNPANIDVTATTTTTTTTTTHGKVSTGQSTISGNCSSSKKKDELEREDQKHKYRFMLTDNTRSRIRVETEKIITQLLDIQKKIMNTTIDTSDLNIILVHYFTTLIGNITSLIYGSDKINTIATIRNMKNQKQQKTTENLSKLLVTTIDLNEIEKNSNIKEHEYTLDPKRICRSLLYSLLIEPFALNDSFGNRIDIWFRDPWLQTVNRFHTRSVREKKEISKTNNIITECLASYNWCPVWVRSMVFNNIA